MNIWYSLIQFLPFEWAEPDHMDFMKNALLALLLIAPIFGLLGTMIINNKMAFFSDALGHGAFTGVVIGGLVGVIQPLWSAIIFSIIFSTLVVIIRIKSRFSSDTVIGIFSSTAVALGIFLSTAGGKNFAKLNNYLVGDILSITTEEIGMIFIALMIVILFWVLFFNKLLIMSVNNTLAKSRAINTFAIEVIFSALIASIVTISMSWVGLLLINSFLILPAASSRNISKSQRQCHLISVLISTITSVIGLILSYYIDTKSGATIILMLSLIFFITFFKRRK